MSEYITDNCGMCVTHSIHDAFSFLKSLNHRGHDAAGIGVVNHKGINVVKWLGMVPDINLEVLHRVLGNDYHTVIGHVRYRTKGGLDTLLDGAHPHTIGGRVIEQGNHRIILGARMAIVHNGQVDERYLGDVSCEGLQSDCDTERLLHYYSLFGEDALMRNVPGSYTLAIADIARDSVIVMRDRAGNKPGALGRKDGRKVVASESIAIEENGGKFLEDLEPGTIYYIGQQGGMRREPVLIASKGFCFFDNNQLSRPESVNDGVHVDTLRKYYGEILAEENRGIRADIVTYLPNCPETAAWSFAHAQGTTFEHLFYKMSVRRAFLGSTTEERRISIEQNLHLYPNNANLIQGKRVVVIDDSIVRGNNVKYGVELLLNAGAASVIVLSYTPPVGIIGSDEKPRGCDLGVDMPADDNFIARGKTIEEISAEVGAEVRYLSLQGLAKAYSRFGVSMNELCFYCIGGPHPYDP